MSQKDRGAADISTSGAKAERDAVAGMKGEAAEGGRMRRPPGQAENIRLTAASVERYGSARDRALTPAGVVASMRVRPAPAPVSTFSM